MAILRNITISCYFDYGKEREFNIRTNCVSSLFLYTLGKFVNNEIQKVIINLTEQEKEPLEILIDVVRVHIVFDFEFFWRSNPIEKKKILLDVLYEGLIEIVCILLWEKKRFDEVYHHLKETDLNFYHFLGKIKSSPNRKKKAQLFYHHDLERTDIFVRVFDKANDDNFKDYFVVSSEPHEYRFVPLLGEISWKNNKVIVIKRKNKKIGDHLLEIEE